MQGIFLGLGSNLGNRKNNLCFAICELRKYRLITVDKVSSFYETNPVGRKKQPDFINAVIQISTDLPPENLLFFLKAIERKMGRISFTKWGPRNIDIDIIFFNNLYIKKNGLIIPHREAKNRLFVLEPLLEIAPDLLYPGTDTRIEKIIKKLK